MFFLINVCVCVCARAGSRALRERGGHLRHTAGEEADDHHREACAAAGVSGEEL